MRQQVLLSVVGLLVAGCSHSPAVGPGASARRAYTSGAGTVVETIQQNVDKADLRVSLTEYQAGYLAFVNCMARAGYVVANREVRFDVIQYGVPAASVSSGVDDRCYVATFRDLDIAWQISHENNSETSEHLARCVATNGLPAQQTVAQMVSALKDSGIDPKSCPA